MDEVRFRRAVVGDLRAIVGLLVDDALGRGREASSGDGEGVDPRYERAFGEIEGDGNQLLVVAEMGGRVVGCLQLTVVPGLSRVGAKRAQVESVRVAGDLRGRGIGRRMMAYVIGEARRRGCTLMQLTTDKSRGEAKRFYESMGFVASHEGMKLDL